jgi:hypothetical protein
MTRMHFSTGISANRVNELPYRIQRAVFNALSPLDQIAAKALEECGKVQIVDDTEQGQPG